MISDNVSAPAETDPEAAYGPRPDGCCGACPPVLGGGYDCTCADNPRCNANHADRYDIGGDRWWWCDKCCGFRITGHTAHSSSYGWPATKINEPYGPLTFAPQPAAPPTAARTERHTPPETWEVRLAWLGDEAIGSDADSGFDIWLDNIRAEAWDKGFRAGRKDKA